MNNVGCCAHVTFLSGSQYPLFSFNSVTVARPAPPDVPLVSTPLVSELPYLK